MKKAIAAIVLMLLFPAMANSATVIGLSMGLPSATGLETDQTFNSDSSFSFMFGINGSGNYSFESGFSQLVDIKDNYGNNERLESSINGMYLAGRYSHQFNDNGFAFAKLGVYRWSANVIEVDKAATSSDAKINQSNISDFAPLFALGGDFITSDNELAIRVEFENIYGIGKGAKLESDNRKRNVSEGYRYNRFSIGVLIAL